MSNINFARFFSAKGYFLLNIVAKLCFRELVALMEDPASQDQSLVLNITNWVTQHDIRSLALHYHDYVT
jgi:hypothetical protein